MQHSFIKTTMLIVLSLIYTSKDGHANEFNADDYNYEQNYSYNIVSAPVWNVSPYIFAGYSFGWIPYYNNSSADYGNMLRNGHNGFIIGAGITINRNWSMGLSFQRLVRHSSLRQPYETLYREIDSIESEVLLTNIDFAMRLPINTRRDLFNILIVSGFNIIVANLANEYKSNATTIPVGLASDQHKAGFGMNVGIALKYRIISGLHAKIECRRMFVLTRKSSLIRDSWLLNIGVGLNF